MHEGIDISATVAVEKTDAKVSTDTKAQYVGDSESDVMHVVCSMLLPFRRRTSSRDRRRADAQLQPCKAMIMHSKRSVAQSIVMAAAVACLAGVVHADDSSLSRFGGEGWRFFDEQRTAATKERSEFRQENRHGLPETYYQAQSSPGPTWHEGPMIDKSAPKYRVTNPRGLTFDDYQALSSNSGQ